MIWPIGSKVLPFQSNIDSFGNKKWTILQLTQAFNDSKQSMPRIQSKSTIANYRISIEVTF